MSDKIQQVRYLITEFYPTAKDIYLDEVEERIYFECDGEMQARINRENELLVFEFKRGEDWYWADSVSFDEVNEVNGVCIF